MTRSLKTETANKLALAAYLRTVPDEKFDMQHWFYNELGPGFPRNGREFLADCGTTACVAGHAAALFNLWLVWSSNSWIREVAKLLGLRCTQSGQLFHSDDATRHDQIRLLENWAREETNANPE